MQAYPLRQLLAGRPSQPRSHWDHVVEHRGVRYEIKIAPGRSQWTWIVHSSPKPKQGSVEGPRRIAILAAEKVINRWWKQRHGRSAARVIENNRRHNPNSS